MGKEEDIQKILSEDLTDIWELLSPEERLTVSENFNLQSFRKNQIIYAEGEEPEYMWCLIRGKVKKYKSGIGDRAQIIRLYRPVQHFGYRAWFAGEKYVSSAMAFEPSLLGFIPMEIVADLIRHNSELAMFFIHELSLNLGGSDTKIVNLTQKHIRGRLAESLIMLLDNYGYDADQSTINIYLSREDLANLSNMTTSNAIRTLTTFVSEKLIVVDGRKIKILNESQLRKISRFG